MNLKFQQLIEHQYGFKIKSVKKAPRQFVAETFIIQTQDNKKYFVKIIDKILFIPRVITSLPVISEIYKQGLTKINYPILNSQNNFYIKSNKVLIALFNYINADQSYDYDERVLGNLIAQVHKITPKIKTQTPKENFKFTRKQAFIDFIKKIINLKKPDQINLLLQNLIKKYELELKKDLANFLNLIKKIKRTNYDLVITHGDAPGNVLVKSPTDIYIVDWDDVLLAPVERDLWILRDHDDFITGYKSIFPNFKINQDLAKFYLYQRYFNDLVEYFVEIVFDKNTQHRENNLKQLEHDCFEGWLRPQIRKLDPR